MACSSCGKKKSTASRKRSTTNLIGNKPKSTSPTSTATRKSVKITIPKKK